MPRWRGRAQADRTAAQGGELGLFKRGALAKVLEDQVFELKPGESTQPIRTRQGFVILKLTEHVAAGPAPLKTVEPQVQEAMYIQQMQPKLRAYLTTLREQAYVDIQPGFPGYRRKREGVEAGVHGVCSACGEEEEGQG